MDRIDNYHNGTDFRGSDIVQTHRLIFMGRRKVRAMEFTGSGDRGRYVRIILTNYSVTVVTKDIQKLKV